MNANTSRGSSPTLGYLLRGWSSLPQPQVRPIDPQLLSFAASDGEALDTSIYQPPSKLRRRRTGPRNENPFALPDSRPPTPRFSSSNVGPQPSRPKSARKGVTIIGISRPAQIGDLWSVEEADWEKMTSAEQRSAYHVAQIMSGGLGQKAPQKCEECARSSSSRDGRVGLLKQCWVYKEDAPGQRSTGQCAACRYSRKGCSFVKKFLPKDEPECRQEPAQNRPDSLVGPTVEDVPKALEQLSGSNWLGNTSINLLLKNVIMLNDAHVIEISNPPADSAGWGNFTSRYTTPKGCRTVFVPLYLSSHSHWTLLTLDMTDLRATFYDPLKMGRAYDVESAASAIVKAFGYDWRASSWELRYAVEVPQQKDSHSCGLVVLLVCMHLTAKIQIPKKLNFRLWRVLFRRALGETAGDCQLDIQGLSHREAEDLTGQVGNAITLLSMLYSQASIEQGKLRSDLIEAKRKVSQLRDQQQARSDSTPRHTDDATDKGFLEVPLNSTRENVARLDRKLGLRAAQLNNLVRACDAATSLHQALASRLDEHYLQNSVHSSRSAPRANSLQQSSVATGQGSTAQCSSNAISDFDVALRLRPSQWRTVLWIAVPDNPPFTQSSTLSIQYFPADINALGRDLYLNEALDTGLGNGVVRKQHGGVYIHQGLATILAVRSTALFSVRLHWWNWLTDQLRNNQLLTTRRDGDGQAESTVVFIHAVTEEPSDLRDVYNDIRNLAPAHGASIRPYPSESEWRHQRMKIGDVRALDEIARSAPIQFSYRPRTCFGQGPCQLLDCETTVHKRSHSSCATHVRVREKGFVGELTCMSMVVDRSSGSPDPRQLSSGHHQNRRNRTEHPKTLRDSKKRKQPVTDQTQKRPTKRPYHPKNLPKDAEQSHQGQDQNQQSEQSPRARPYWFHQEFVPGLHQSEFRVFIATKPDSQGIRGRSGFIVAMAKTAWHWDTKALAVSSVDDEADFHYSSCGTHSRSQLEQFSLHVFEALRSRDDHLFHYESLEVGVRLDVGVADGKQGEKSFFVNEITRWYNAHYFSNNICPEPKTQICRAFAEAFSSYVHRGMPKIP